jgi:hypothetical protein
MDYEFRKKLYELDEIGCIGTQGAKETEKDKIITSYLIQASKKVWKEQGRSLTEEEKNIIIQNAKKAYNTKIRQDRKTKTFAEVASVTL